MRSGTIVALAAILLMAGAGLSAAQDKEAQIKARQDFMEAQQKDVNAINAYAKGEGDKATALDKLKDLIARAPKIVDQFPPGTSMKEFPDKTKAKPEIWAEWDKAKLMPDGLKAAEEKLVGTIDTGTPQQVGETMRTIYRENCNGCHTPYRAPKS